MHYYPRIHSHTQSWAVASYCSELIFQER